MKRTKIGGNYFRNGHGRSSKRKATIWLIDGFAYAKDSSTAASDMCKLSGLLKGYVRVNILSGSFFQVDGYSPRKEHKPYVKA